MKIGVIIIYCLKTVITTVLQDKDDIINKISSNRCSIENDPSSPPEYKSENFIFTKNDYDIEDSVKTIKNSEFSIGILSFEETTDSFLIEILKKCKNCKKFVNKLKIEGVTISSEKHSILSKILSDMNIVSFHISNCTINNDLSESIFSSFISSRSLKKLYIDNMEITESDIRVISLILSIGIVSLTKVSFYDINITEEMAKEIYKGSKDNITLKRLFIKNKKVLVNIGEYISDTLAGKNNISQLLYYEPPRIGQRGSRATYCIEYCTESKDIKLNYSYLTINNYLLLLNAILFKGSKKIRKVQMHYSLEQEKNVSESSLRSLGVTFESIYKNKILIPTIWLNCDQRNKLNEIAAEYIKRLGLGK